MMRPKIAKKQMFLMYVNRFRHEKTYINAREVWLFCHHNDCEVPHDILDKFAAGIRKEVEKARKRRRMAQGVARLKSGSRAHKNYLLYRYVNLLKKKKNISINRALDRYIDVLEEFRQEEMSYEDAKKRYYEMRSILQEYKE